MIDILVGCKTRAWVRDAPVNTRQAWMDGYLLTGMMLGEPTSTAMAQPSIT